MSMFCPDCGSLLKPKTLKSGRALFCSCGYTDKEGEIAIKEEIKTKDVDYTAIESDQDEKRLPLTDAECQRCGHRKAHYWLVQTRAGDEAETKFCRCEQCKHTWREYD